MTKTFLLALLSTVCIAQAADLPVSIKPDDPKIYYIGRFDTRDSKGPRCQWSQSMVTLRFHGTDLQVKLNDGGKDGDDYYELVVDDQPPKTIHPDKNETTV